MASVLKCRVSVQFSVSLSVSVPLIDSRITSRGFSGSRYRSAAATAAIVYSKHLFWWEGYSPQNIPFHLPAGCQIVCSKSFCGRGNESQIYHGNFLLMDSKHRKLFVIKQSKGCRFMPKMHQSTFGSWALPGPAGGAYVLPQNRPHSRNGGLFVKGRESREGVYF